MKLPKNNEAEEKMNEAKIPVTMIAKWSEITALNFKLINNIPI